MKKPFALLFVLLVASLACNAALGGKSIPEPSPVGVNPTSTPFDSPSPTSANKVEESPTEAPAAEPATDATLEHHWAARSFSDPETGADPDMADGEPDVTNCADPFLPTWAPPASPEPVILTLNYTTPLVPSQVNIFHLGNPAEILRVEVLNSLSGLGKLIFDSEKDKVSVSGKCPATLSLPVKADFEVDTIIITVAASENPPQIDAVELVGKLRGFIVLPVFWRVPLSGTPVGLAVGQDSLVYVITDPDGYANYANPARDELFAYDVEGNQLKKFSIPNGANLTDVATDPFGNLVVVDQTYGWFIVLSSEGQQLTAGGEGLAGQVAVSPQDGNVYLLNGYSIRVYTSDTGKILREMPLDDLHSYRGLAFDPQGRLFMLRDYDWDLHLIQLDPLTGEELDAIPLRTSEVIDNVASDLAIDANGNIYVLFIANTGAIAVHKLDPQGNLLSRFGKLDYDSDIPPEGAFFEPRAIAVSPDGRFIFIADGYDEKSHLTAFLLEPEE